MIGGSDREGFSSINVTPLVDVMLVLLIVFMVTAPMLVSSVDIELPRADLGAASSPSQAPIVVTVDEGGAMQVDDGAVTEVAALESTVREAVGQGRSRVAVRADGRCAYARVAEVLAAARRAGAVGIDLVMVDEGAAK